jgi:REP element-mobilizing transposase RayT
MPRHHPELEFVDPRRVPFEPPRSRGELPHLYKDGCSYFVTSRLWDAVTPSPPCGAGVPPANVDSTSRDKTGVVVHPPAAEEIAARSEPPLRLGSCVLADPACADIVQRALLHFDRQRYYLTAWCVMPNHVHAVFTVLPTKCPSDVLHSWKSYSAHAINRRLRRRGTLWERESFDHVIRSIEHFAAFVNYVEQNPVAAGLCAAAADWPYSSACLGNQAAS